MDPGFRRDDGWVMGSLVLADPDATIAAGRALGARLAAGDVVALAGALGAGKTLLTKGILEALGFAGEVPSPSFPIVIPYEPPAVRLPLWHVDLYRIDDPGDIDELGLEEVRRDGALVIEWPERMGPALPADSLRIQLSVEPDGARRLTAVTPPSWEARCPFP